MGGRQLRLTAGLDLIISLRRRCRHLAVHTMMIGRLCRGHTMIIRRHPPPCSRVREAAAAAGDGCARRKTLATSCRRA